MVLFVFSWFVLVLFVFPSISCGPAPWRQWTTLATSTLQRLITVWSSVIGPLASTPTTSSQKTNGSNIGVECAIAGCHSVSSIFMSTPSTSMLAVTWRRSVSIFLVCRDAWVLVVSDIVFWLVLVLTLWSSVWVPTREPRCGAVRDFFSTTGEAKRVRQAKNRDVHMLCLLSVYNDRRMPGDVCDVYGGVMSA